MYVRVYFPWFSYITHLKINSTYLLRHYAYRVTLYFIIAFPVSIVGSYSKFLDYFRLFYSAGCVSLTYFDLLWSADLLPGLLSLGSNPTKYPISPLLRCSRSRCYCYNLQVGLGFLFSMFIIFRFSPRAIIQDSYLSLYFGEHSF